MGLWLMWVFNEKTWAVIGKVAMVVGIFGGIAGMVRIYEYFSASHPELIAHCSYSIYELPPDLLGMMVDLHNSRAGKYPSGVQDAITGHLDSFKNFIDRIAEATRGNEKLDENKKLYKSVIENNTKILIENTLRDIIPSSFNDSYNPYKGILNFSIRNGGNEVAKNVVISLPFDGKTSIVSQSKERHALEVRRSIEIGDIRQEETVWIDMWSTEPPALKHEGSIRLTHNSGIGKISFAVSEFGLSYTILRDYHMVVALVLYLLLCGSVIGCAFLIEHVTGIYLITTRPSE